MPIRVVRWLVAGLAVALVVTAFRVTSQVMTSMADHGHDWWRVFVWQLAGWGYWTAAAPLLLRRGGAIAHARPWWKPLPLAVAVGAGLVVFHVVFVAGVVTVVQHFQPVAVYSFAEALSRQLNRWIAVDVAVVVGLPVVGFILATRHRARQLEINESRLEAELARAELEALRLQMQPHFLFNTLNSIAALIRRGDGQAALDMVVELGAMLRDTVGRSRRDTVPPARRAGLRQTLRRAPEHAVRGSPRGVGGDPGGLPRPGCPDAVLAASGGERHSPRPDEDPAEAPPGALRVARRRTSAPLRARR